MDERIFGLLPVVDRDGFMLGGVTRMDLTASGRNYGLRVGYASDGLDSPEVIVCGSVVDVEGGGMQRAAGRGWCR